MRPVIFSLSVLVLLAACREQSTAPALPSRPATPSSVIALAAPNRHIHLSWVDNADNEDGYKIERKTGNGGSYSQVGAVTTNAVAFEDSVPAPGTNYFYHIAAFNAAGSSAYSEAASARTLIEIAEAVAKDYESPDNPAQYAAFFYGVSGSTMELSYGSITQAWFYFWEPSNTFSFVWEFSPISVTDLNLVSLDSVQAATFYAHGDPRLPGIFGADNGDNAVRRPVGAILLARQAAVQEIVFALQLDGVKYPFMTIRYFALNMN